MNPSRSDVQPWYRHPWPWLLMMAPVTAIVWGVLCLVLATVYRDPLVTEHAWRDGQALQAGQTVNGTRSGP